VIHRGDVLVADLRPILGHEQGGRRPVLVLSTDVYNSWPIDMLFVAPITSVRRGLEHHVSIGEDAGLRGPSFVMPEYTRAISVQRVSGPALGSAQPSLVEAVQRWLSYFTSEASTE
jgi:mRNA interferase MazF